MKRLYIHIGHAKCGSSSIQSFCVANRSSLARNGYDFPPTSGLPFHGELSPTFNKFAGISGDAERARDRMLAYINETRCDSIILSCEAFHQDELDVFEPFFESFDVKIVYYIRRQADYLESIVNQRIKEGTISYGIDWLAEVPYYNVIRKFSDRLGTDAIRVRILDRSLLANQDLIHDFLTTVDYPFPAACPYQAPQNVSLKGDVLRFCAHLALVPLDQHERASIAQDLERLSEEYFTDQPISILTVAQRAFLAHSHANDNARIALEFARGYDAEPVRQYFSAPRTPDVDFSRDYDIYGKLRLDREAMLAVFARLSSKSRSTIIHRCLVGSDYDPKRRMAYVNLPELERTADAYERRRMACNLSLLQRQYRDFEAWRMQRDMPKLLEEYHGYNIVQFREKFYAIPHGISIDWIEDWTIPPDPNVLVRVDVAYLRSTIDRLLTH